MAKNANKFFTFLLIFFLSGSYIFIFSESGLLERIQLKKKNKTLITKIKALQDKRLFLGKKLQSLNNGNISSKSLSEIGYVKPGAKVAILKQFTSDKKKNLIEKDKDHVSFKMGHLRIIWITVSILVIILHFSRIAKQKNEQ